MEIDESTLIVKNAYKEIITQNCDDRNITISGNHLISFNNCEIKIKQKIFKNSKEKIEETYFYQNDIKLNFSEIKPIEFENLTLLYANNIKEIKLLKFHNKVSYGISTTLLISIIIIVIVIIYLVYKAKSNKIKITNKIVQKEIQEDFETRGGGVMSTSKPIEVILEKYKN